MSNQLNAEAALLGCIIADNSITDDVRAAIKVNDFYQERHKAIYQDMLNLASKQKPIDLVGLIDALTLSGKLEAVGGIGYIMQLNVPTAANYQSYVDIVKRDSVKRQLVQMARIINEDVKTADDTEAMMNKARQLLDGIDRGSGRNDAEQGVDITSRVIDSIFANSEKDIIGIKTGFTMFDALTDGLHSDELIILAARPGMGKTAFALNVAMHVAKSRTVLVFSLEMSKEDLVKRLMSAYTNISIASLRHPTRLPELIQERIWGFGQMMQDTKLIISDTADQSMDNIRATTRQVKHAHGLDLIIVDYLTLIRPNAKQSREQEVAEISRFLKMLAKEYHVPVIALAQVNRMAEGRSDKRPALSDLRESGSLEQDADMVLFLYREEYYNPETEKKNTADLIIAKHRNGPLGTIPLYFEPTTTRFGNLELQR